jgi:hypothetical protein
MGGTNCFDRTWAEFKVGFGIVGGNLWLGNDMLHLLTSCSAAYNLRFDLQSRDNGA